jgi:enoyl-CoA hydratase
MEADVSLIIERIGAVTLVTLDRPQVANAVSTDMAVGIAEAIDAFAADDDARVLVVTGSGERAFSAGGDLSTLLETTSHAHADRAGPLGFARLEPGKPTIAAVNGYCFGGGMELALWCDFRIASENAEFGALNRQWGVTLIDGGTQRLPRIVGYGNAMYLVNTGARISASRALEMGLVQEVVAPGAALNRALELAREIAEYPQPALLADRAGVVASTDLPLDDGILFEARTGRGVMDEPAVVQRLTEFSKARNRAARPGTGLQTR